MSTLVGILEAFTIIVLLLAMATVCAILLDVLKYTDSGYIQRLKDWRKYRRVLRRFRRKTNSQ